MSPPQEPPRIGLSIPLFDEEEVVQSMVEELVTALRRDAIPFALALVNNGSQDQTGTIVDSLAQSPQILAIHLKSNAGYGGGILAGLEALEAQYQPEILGWCWGDGQVDPNCLLPLYRACTEGAPVAKAVRTRREDGLFRSLQGRVYGWVLAKLGQPAADPHGCPKLFRREALHELNLRHTDWFIDAEAMLGAATKGWRIAETPVTMRARTGGRSKVRLSTTLEFCGNLRRWKHPTA